MIDAEEGSRIVAEALERGCKRRIEINDALFLLPALALERLIAPTIFIVYKLFDGKQCAVVPLDVLGRFCLAAAAASPQLTEVELLYRAAT